MPRRDLDFSLKEVGDLATALDFYKALPTLFTGLDRDQKETLSKFWTESIVKREDKLWLTDFEFSLWCDVDIHVVKQTWGNTSGGWESIGGAAMTSTYTTIIENLNFKFACIFYGGRIAYICRMDEAYRGKERVLLPGVSSCSRSGLDIIYKRSV